MEELDILTLDNGNDYVITKKLNYKENDYLLLIQVDKDENLLPEEKIIVQKMKDSSGEYLSVIEDDLTNQIVSEKFAKMLLEDIVE